MRADGDIANACKFNRIADQIVENLLQPVFVGLNRRQIGTDFVVQPERLRADQVELRSNFLRCSRLREIEQTAFVSVSKSNELLAAELKNIADANPKNWDAPYNDTATFQEWAQARGLPPPSYTEVTREGPDHQPLFTVEVKLTTGEVEQAMAGAKRQAEQAAAKALLARMEMKNA